MRLSRYGIYLFASFTKQVVQLEDPGVVGGCSSGTVPPPLALAGRSRKGMCASAAVANKNVSPTQASWIVAQQVCP